MSNIEQEMDGEERRRFFRIDDTVLMSIRRIDQQNVDDELEKFEEKREVFCFMNTAEFERDQQLAQLRSIQQSNPDIAGYFIYLESRLDQLTKILSAQQDDPAQLKYRVNISAQGIRFHSDRIYDTDDLVELRISLLPDRKRLLLIGTVVWCIEDPKAIGKHINAIAVDFTYIHEADREVLVKHIQAKQMQQLSLKQFGNH